jgi:hypothetical protein
MVMQWNGDVGTRETQEVWLKKNQVFVFVVIWLLLRTSSTLVYE